VNFRNRVSLLAGAAVAVSVVAASLTLYFVVRHQMLEQVDASLRDRVPTLGSIVVSPKGTGTGLDVNGTKQLQPGAVRCVIIEPGPVPEPPPATCPNPVTVQNLPPPKLGGPGGFSQFVDSQGHVTLPLFENVSLPVTSADLDVAAGTRGMLFEDATVQGTPVRVVTAPVFKGVAIQVARPLDEVDTVLSHLRWILIAVCAAGVAVAALLGRLVARTTLRPVSHLMEATEHVADTHDLGRRIEEPGQDELGRLAHSFNRMLEALDTSERTQRQLIADASHELRTPLSSLRTNIEVLAREHDLSGPERDRLLADVMGQLERLSRLVANLIELARGDEPISRVRADVALDELVAGAVDVARTHFPGIQFSLEATPSVVQGDPERITRAVANLLDNAGKWSPPGATVEVQVSGGEVVVRDHGPGIAPEYVPQVFRRFWRAPEAKHTPGSGLGLAIVQQVAASHDGTVVVEMAPGGGALLRLQLPAAS